MKILLCLPLLTLTALFQAGCSSGVGVSAGHNGHTHGVGVAGTAGRSGVGVGARAQ